MKGDEIKHNEDNAKNEYDISNYMISISNYEVDYLILY